MKSLISAVMCFCLFSTPLMAEEFSNPSTSYGTSTNKPGSRINRARGHAGDIEHIYSGDVLNGVYGRGYDTSSFGTTDDVAIEEQAAEDFSTTANGTKVLIKVVPVTTTSQSTIMTIDGTGVTITGALTATTMGANLGVLVATQTIAAAGTIAADACGSIKRISSAGVVTSSTTDTMSVPSTSNAMCVMDVCNVGSNNITLDNNSHFKSIGGADIVLTPDDCTRVGQVGGYWASLGSLVAN